MTHLNTYNRVKSLESKRFSTLINLYYLSLLISIIGSLVILALITSLRIPAISWAIGGTLILAVSYYWDRNRPKSCQFCDTTLSMVNRPIVLNSNYLSMKGLKEGNYFYTKCRWGANPLIERWTKISNRSKVCNHCRLTEETIVRHFESVTLEEQQRVEFNIDQ